MVKRSVLLFDKHIPFQDKQLQKHIFKFLKDLKLTSKDEIVLGGDILDFWAVSSFDKRPSATISGEDVAYERDSFVEYIRDLRKTVGPAKIIFIKGNHCDRWQKYLYSNAKALAGLPELDIRKFLRLDKYKVIYEPKEYKANPHFLVKHGTATSKYPSKTEVDTELMSGASGHAHKTDRSYKRGHGKNYRWYSFGHLADRDQIDDACKYSVGLKWDQSFGILLTDLKNNKWDMEVMHCNKGFYSKYLRREYGKKE